MAREQTKEILPVIQTFVEGKTIQDWTNDTWKDKEYTSFGELSQSPIKPEPKYRPFKSQEECWEEMHKHPDFGWVLCDGVYLHLLDVYCNATHTNEQHDGIDYDDALEELTFTDGAPFGIKEE